MVNATTTNSVAPSAAAPEHPPIIDLANFEERRDEIVKELMEAATTVGFFYIKNSGITQELVDRAFAINAKYFDQPLEEKLKLPRVDWGARKLLGYEINKLPGDGLLHESHIHCWDVHPIAETAWPDEKLVPGFKETTLEFMNALPPVVDRVMSCFALGLGYPADFFKETTNPKDPDCHTFLQYHKYPACDGLKWKEGTNRITAHTDESLMTLLFTSPNSTGLELAAGKDGMAVGSSATTNGHYKVEKWHPCPPIPGCITVNVGDPLQFWSDGVLKSNYHRVRMPLPGESTAARYSIGYFTWPRDHDVIAGPKGVYPPTTMADFMKVKGQMYGDSFHPDPEKYEEVQKVAFGVPQLNAISAAS